MFAAPPKQTFVLSSLTARRQLLSDNLCQTGTAINNLKTTFNSSEAAMCVKKRASHLTVWEGIMTLRQLKRTGGTDTEKHFVPFMQSHDWTHCPVVFSGNICEQCEPFLEESASSDTQN